MVRGVPSMVTSYYFYRPHNYRLYVRFFKGSRFPLNPELFSSTKSLKREPWSHNLPPQVTHGLINHGSEYTIKGFLGCSWRVKKDSIEISPVTKCQEWHKIDKSSMEQMSGQMINICVGLRDFCLEGLKEFISTYGGSSDFEVIREVSKEHKLLNDEVIDSIPRSERFDTPNFRKAYNEANFEFKSLEGAMNYVENRAIDRVAPMIADKLEEIRLAVMSPSRPLLSPLESLKLDIKLFPGDVLCREEEVTALSDDDKASLTDWLFETFGGVNSGEA